MTTRKFAFWIIAATGFIVLCSLGTWQVYRLNWKNNLIATKKAALTESPLSIEIALQNTELGQEVEFKRVQIKGRWVEDTLYYIIGRTHKGRAGYHVVAPLKLDSGQVIFVNLGWSDKKELIDLKGPVNLEGYIRYPYKNAFTPNPIVEKKEWGAVLPEQMRSALSGDYKIIEKIYIQLKDPSPFPELRALKKIILTIDIPNRHLGYIITWYGLAIAWLFVMIYSKNT